MAIYKNDYTKNEDETLWELHEARHRLNKRFNRNSLNSFNKTALTDYSNWKKEHEKAVNSC